MMLQPEYLVMDEPLASLDVSVQAQLLNLLNDLKTRYRVSYIFISHDLNAVRFLCDRAAVMYGGRIREILSADNLDHAFHPYTRELINASPRLFTIGERKQYNWERFLQEQNNSGSP